MSTDRTHALADAEWRVLALPDDGTNRTPQGRLIAFLSHLTGALSPAVPDDVWFAELHRAEAYVTTSIGAAS